MEILQSCTNPSTCRYWYRELYGHPFHLSPPFVSPVTRCQDLQTCEQCQKNPACGWCDDGQNVGLGACMEGGADGPMEVNGTTAIPAPQKCPQLEDRWFFVKCPGKNALLHIGFLCLFALPYTVLTQIHDARIMKVSNGHNEFSDELVQKMMPNLMLSCGIKWHDCWCPGLFVVAWSSP